MTPAQEHLYKLLKEIDAICKKHDIEYFLEQGTILGAVRHGGFLPWDNDLDIGMTEPNYNKFVKACQEELDGTTRTFCDNRLDREFPTVFGHYIDLTCCRVTAHTSFWKYHVGQTIDVFCWVELPGDIQENKRIANLYYAYDEYVNQSFKHYSRTTDDIKAIYENLYKREKEIGREAVLAELDAEIFGHHYEDCTMLMCTTARMHWNTFMPKAAYDYMRKVPFEDMMVNIPGDWYELMCLNYDDKFCMVPRDPMIHTEMSYTNITCRAYVDDYLSAIDKDQMLANRLKFKHMGVENGNRQAHLNKDFFAARGALVKANLEARIAAENIDVMALVEEGTPESIATLSNLLEEYLASQVHSSTQYWRCHYNCSDEVDLAAMYLLLVAKDDVLDIQRLIQVRLQTGHEVTPAMMELLAKAKRYRSCKKHWHYGELEEGRKDMDWVLENLPYMHHAQTWDLLYKVAMAQSDADYQAALEQADTLLAEQPDDDRAAKAKADTLLALGRTQEAQELYDRLKRDCLNGFILLDIDRKVKAGVIQKAEA